MKRIRLFLVLVVAGLFAVLAGCEGDTLNGPDLQAPATPRGVYSVTGDHSVKIVWLGSDEQDLDGYRVWRSMNVDGPYHVIAEITVSDLPVRLEYTDHDVQNGETYFYAVSSFDYAGNESELSYEDVFDTPRPAGYGVALAAREYRAEDAGFDFSRHTVVHADDPDADIRISQDGTVFYLEAVDGIDVLTDIQDFGYTETLDAVDWAPPSGWSANGWLEIIGGHTYIVWTRDNHFAKIRVTQINVHSIRVDWAYQVDVGNPELKPAVPRIGVSKLAVTENR